MDAGEKKRRLPPMDCKLMAYNARSIPANFNDNTNDRTRRRKSMASVASHCSGLV